MKQYSIYCQAQAYYSEEHSTQTLDSYVFHYHITLINNGNIPAQLIARYWWVTDETGETQHVAGLGVIGKQPLLQIGERYEYTSWTMIKTLRGKMRGNYIFFAEDGKQFDCVIPSFDLVVPVVKH